eukprot:4069674-Prymnesium_polylepis.1
MPDRKISRAAVVSWYCSLRYDGFVRRDDRRDRTHLGLRSAHCANMAAQPCSKGCENVGPETSWCVCNLARIRKLRTSGQRLPE